VASRCFVVCAIRHTIREDADTDTVEAVIPIAGDFSAHGGHAFSYETIRLKKSEDADKPGPDGLRLVLKGGVYEEKEQQAVLEFVCDGDRTGLEDEWEGEDQYEARSNPTLSWRRVEGGDERGEKEDGGDGEKDGLERTMSPGSESQLSKGDPSLVWNSYGRLTGGEEYVLHMTWKTKYACENATEGGGEKEGEKEGDSKPSQQWGFFTWIVILWVSRHDLN
jgi:hypothetical protein